MPMIASLEESDAPEEEAPARRCQGVQMIWVAVMVLGMLAIAWIIGGIKHRKETNRDRILTEDYIAIGILGLLAVVAGLCGFAFVGQ